VSTATVIAEAAGCQLARQVILAAEGRLRRSCFPELRLGFCTFSEGILTLSGVVSNHFLRRLAANIMQGLGGVVAVDNQFMVKPHSARHLSVQRNRMGVNTLHDGAILRN